MGPAGISQRFLNSELMTVGKEGAELTLSGKNQRINSINSVWTVDA